jgi:hypothetical protein
MTLAELKQSIHRKIDIFNDMALLEQINAIVTKEELFTIPSDMKSGVAIGLEDLQNDRVKTQKDFDKKYEAWLKG